MEEDHLRAGFFQMLQDCYGLWTWEYDEKLELLSTNSISPYLHGRLLLGKNRKEVILEHGRNASEPLIISNIVGTTWAVVVRRDQERQVQGFYAIGPVLTGKYSRKEVERTAETLNLSISKKLALIDCLQAVPYISIQWRSGGPGDRRIYGPPDSPHNSRDAAGSCRVRS